MGRSADLPRTSGEIDGDDTGCHVLHVDMDAFFASVEIRANPELRGLPVVVGGANGRGVVAAASYEARKYGIRSAMSMAMAQRLCPRLVVVTPQRGAYSQTSAAIMKIFAEFTPHIEPLSLDEAFLDISGAVGLFGRPADIARKIRARVYEQEQLTCSVGVAPIKSVAKLASGSCKPNGLRVVSRDGLLDFLQPLPVTALWGVGARTAEPLRRLGIRTVGELAATPLDTLRRAVGAAAAQHLHDLSNGIDNRAVTPRAEEKSISTDRTMARDLLTEAEVARELLRGAGEVAERARQAGRVARTVGIKIRFADFATITRVRTLAEPTDAAAVVYAEALALYRALDLDQPRIRLVGVKLENLRPVDEATQLALDFDDPRTGSTVEPSAPSETAADLDQPARAGTPARADAPAGTAAPARSTAPSRSAAASRAAAEATDRAIDALVARFGQAVVRPASLLDPRAIPSAGGLNRAKNRVDPPAENSP